MNVLGLPVLEQYKLDHADIRPSADSWIAEVKEANWEKPLDLKQKYPKASILADNYVVFNLRGNYYRLLVKINYKNKIVLIKKVGTHKEYMQW